MLIGIHIILGFNLSAQTRSTVEWRNVNGVEIPVPPSVHPRLYLRSSDIPELKERIKHPEIVTTIKRWRN